MFVLGRQHLQKFKSSQWRNNNKKINPSIVCQISLGTIWYNFLFLLRCLLFFCHFIYMLLITFSHNNVVNPGPMLPHITGDSY